MSEDKAKRSPVAMAQSILAEVNADIRAAYFRLASVGNLENVSGISAEDKVKILLDAIDAAKSDLEKYQGF